MRTEVRMALPSTISLAKQLAGKCLEVVVDSGCGKPCAPIALASGRVIEETDQSRRGHNFVGPGGEKYPNKGKIKITGTNEQGARTQLHFHVAEGIQQPLASVAAINDADNIAIFDSSGEHHGSRIVKASSPEGRQIRELVQKAKGTEMRRIKNTYIARIWMDDDSTASSAAGFRRQGS